MLRNCMTYGVVPLLMDRMVGHHNTWIRTDPPKRNDIIFSDRPPGVKPLPLMNLEILRAALAVSAIVDASHSLILGI